MHHGADPNRHVDVVVTTYTYFERESGKDDRRFLRSQPWEYMVLDEAHGVKNMKTARWNNLKMLRSRRKLLLLIERDLSRGCRRLATACLDVSPRVHAGGR